MADLDYIKSYLIKLGIDIDQTELKQWDQSLNRLDGSFKKVSKSLEDTDKKIGISLKNKILIWGKSFAKAGSFLAAASVGIAKFLQSTANSDMEMQKFARSMYLSENRAKALKNTLGAMDLSFGDLRDVAYNPELLAQYKEFLSLAKSFKEPEGMKNSFRDIRSIFAEFQKFNLTFTYFRERVAHFIYKVVQDPAKKFKNFLQNFNKNFSININNWAKKIGTFFGSILRLGLRLAEMVRNFGELISRLWNRLDGFWKAFIIGFTVFNRILKTSPIGRFITLLTALLALYDDYKTFKEGGVSSKTLKPVWQTIEDQRNSPDSILNKIINLIKEVINFLNMIAKSIKEVWNKLANSEIGKKWGLTPFDIKDENFRNTVIPYIEKEVPPIKYEFEGENRLYKVIKTESSNKKEDSFSQMQNLGLNKELENATNSPINQTFNFNLSTDSLSNPQSFLDEVSFLIRNNKSELVG